MNSASGIGKSYKLGGFFYLTGQIFFMALRKEGCLRPIFTRNADSKINSFNLHTVQIEFRK